MTKSELKTRFRSVFKDAPAPELCRAPGRINLIGEHTDYCGIPVMPMAINRYVEIAFAPRDDGIANIANVDDSFKPESFSIPEIPARHNDRAWTGYCKAAMRELNRHFEIEDVPGIDMLVSGSVPVAAGLSSSSALVVASALAYLRVLGKELENDIAPLELAECLARAERYVGAQSGGMDQAIILAGQQDHVAKIDFFPLNLEHVPLPPGIAIVACNSMVKAEKSGAMLQLYNEGPVTCDLIARLVEKYLQKEFDEEIEIDRLGDLWRGALCMTHEEVHDLLDSALPNERMTLAQVAGALDLSQEALGDTFPDRFTEPAGGFDLQAKARHERTEYRRVELARDALLSDDGETFGQLMLESHGSCAEDFGVSTPELDDLVSVAMEGGAIGARLTGAGFGGCTVNLVPQEALDDFRRHLESKYYEKRMSGSFDHAFFEVTAVNGANYA